jgi:exodeoxyribonuclease III
MSTGDGQRTLVVTRLHSSIRVCDGVALARALARIAYELYNYHINSIWDIWGMTIRKTSASRWAALGLNAELQATSAPGRTLRIFTLNISGPSMERAARILDFLADLDPDVVVLTETRGSPGTRFLLDAYRHAGYAVLAPGSQLSGERGVAIIHRMTASGSRPEVSRPDLAYRLLMTDLGAPGPIALIGAYVPSRDTSPEKIERKQTFLRQMLTLVRAVSANQDVILMGDFNIIDRTHVPRYSAFRSWEYDALVAIRDCGLVEGFAHLYPDERAYSWFGRTGDGYRYDYGFLSKSLLTRLRDCEYIDATRQLGLSDHSGLLMIIESAQTTTVQVDDPRLAERQALLI